MDDSSETMDHNNASFASMEPVAANKKECLPRTAVSNIKPGRLQISNPSNNKVGNTQAILKKSLKCVFGCHILVVLQ